MLFRSRQDGERRAARRRDLTRGKRIESGCEPQQGSREQGVARRKHRGKQSVQIARSGAFGEPEILRAIAARHRRPQAHHGPHHDGEQQQGPRETHHVQDLSAQRAGAQTDAAPVSA